MILRVWSRVFLVILAIGGLIPGTLGCGGEHRDAAAGSAIPPAATPATVTAADLEKLSWIEGTWRGTGDVAAPFFERYYFENGRTLVVEKLAAESADTITDSTRYELSDGRFASARSVATAIDDHSVTFARGPNSFRWQRESVDVWSAVLRSPDGERVYRMERWPGARPRR